MPISVLVAPAVGEPLAEPRAGHLPAELGPETPAGVAGASRYRALDVAQLGLYAGLDGPNDPSGQLHAIRNPSSPWKRGRLSRQGDAFRYPLLSPLVEVDRINDAFSWYFWSFP